MWLACLSDDEFSGFAEEGALAVEEGFGGGFAVGFNDFCEQLDCDGFAVHLTHKFCLF